MTSMGGRKLLDARRKKIGIEISVLLEQVDELRAEAADIDTATTVLDRYAIRLPGGKSESVPALQQEHDAAFGPVTHAIVDMPDDATKEAEAATIPLKDAPLETKKIESVDLRKKTWTLEQKAEASRMAKERWAKRQRLPPVEERPRANFQKNVIPSEKPATSHERKYGLQPPKIASAASSETDKKLLKDKRAGIFNKDTSQTEPTPAWRGKPGQQPDITSIDLGGVPVSLAGFYLMINGQPSVRLDKWQKAVLGELMKDYPEQTLRVQVKGMVRDIDAVIGQLRGFPGLAPLEIITTHGGWKLKEMHGEFGRLE